MSNASLYQVLAEHCVSNAVRSYLEIGTRDGDSLKVVAQNAKQLERVTVCDMWGNDYGGSGRGSHDHIDRMLGDLGYTCAVEYHDGDSRDTVPGIAGQFDLVLVDGDHSVEGALIDLLNTWPKVAKGGALVFHDITHPSHMELLDVFLMFAKVVRPDGYRTVLEPYGVGVIYA